MTFRIIHMAQTNYRRLIQLVFFVVMNVSLAAAADQELVGQAGDPASIVIRGHTVVPVVEVRRAIANNLYMGIVGHPQAPRDVFLRELASSVLQGFLQSGYKNAVVQSLWEDGRVILNLESGPCYLAGPLEIDAPPDIIAVVRRAVTERWPKRYKQFLRAPPELDTAPETECPEWNVGKPVDWRTDKQLRLERCIEEELVASGSAGFLP
ncbi:MAG: hypothetical protein AAB263_15710, partial [Planctomycetota bacterium]